MGVRRPGSRKPIQVNNVSIVVDDIIGSTGLELKVSFLHYRPLLTTMGLIFKTSGGLYNGQFSSCSLTICCHIRRVVKSFPIFVCGQMDPGVAPVYAGFGGLMLTTVISYLSHSQVWALQEGTSLVVGGKSNRARFEFEKELNEILDCVPEIRTKKQRGDFSSTETATQKQ